MAPDEPLMSRDSDGTHANGRHLYPSPGSDYALIGSTSVGRLDPMSSLMRP